MADRFENTTKTMAILAVIFFVLLIILFFVLEFRFLKRIMVEYEDNIQRIVMNEVYSFMHELEFAADSGARSVSGEDARQTGEIVDDIVKGNPRISNVTLLDNRGYVLYSLQGRENYPYPGDDYKKARTGRPYTFSTVERDRVNELNVSTVLNGGSGKGGYLLISFRTNDLQQEFILKYATEKIKIALVDEEGYPLVWPFARDQIGTFDPDRENYATAGVTYNMQRSELENSNISVLFFLKDTHFDKYRIIVIMFLLFALYFLIYHFIVEFFNINNVNSYFDNIDFNIFNHLQEGIIIANKFGRLVYANSQAHQIFDSKRIEPGKTALSELIGPMQDDHGRITLKKSEHLLEIISSPIIKNGKLLGSLVVIGQDTEKERLCHNAMGSLFEHLQDGLVFVDRECKIIASNMMARYYLGNMENGIKLDQVNTELTALVEKNIGSARAVREKLTWPDILCELLPVYDGDGLYAGTVIFIKDDTKLI